jgi:Leucine-rich repeat (LRR) protein
LQDISKLVNLETLSAANCSLAGKVPALSTLASLEAVYLQENHLTGTIPELPTHDRLRRVWFSDNKLTGSTPDISRLPLLDMLHLERNRLDEVHPSVCEWDTAHACSSNHCRQRECVLNGNPLNCDASLPKQACYDKCAAECAVHGELR